MLDWHSCQICYPLEIKILLYQCLRFSYLTNKFYFTGIGVYNGRDKTKQGFDLIFGTNHLGTFLLTYLLLDLLKRSAPSQIINLTSAAHYSVWKTLKFKDGEINVFSYPGSKIANIMHARELSKRYKGKYALYEYIFTEDYFELVVLLIFGVIHQKNR